MRIERLDLTAFGHFSDRSLDLSGEGLQLIYGANAAGKTTARVAITNLLYDYELRTTYAFVHPMNRLQLGAKVSDGTRVLEVARWKKQRDGLVDLASGAAVTEADWQSLLHHVTKSEFEALFTLGWEDLVQGTEQLVARGGALGETLFAAGLGLRELGAVLEHLESEANALFAPNASTRTVNAALRAFAARRRAAAEASVRPSHYAEVDKHHRAAVAVRDQATIAWREVEREHSRLVTLRGALPQLRARARLVAERAALRDDGPVATPAWATRVEELLGAREQLVRRRAEATERLRVALEQLGAIEIDANWLEIAPRIDALAEGIAAYEQGRSDRGGLEEGRHLAEAQALSLLESLADRPVRLEELEGAASLVARRRGFTQRRDEWTARHGELERARQALRASEEEIASIDAALPPASPVPDLLAVRAVFDMVARLGDLDAPLADAEHARSSRGAARLQAGRLLGYDEAAIATALGAAAPSLSETAEIIGALDEPLQRAQRAEERAASARDRLDELLAERAQLEVGTELPSEDDLRDARDARGARWHAVRRVWLEGLDPAPAGYATPEELASQLEAATQHADEVADHLWRSADQTARRHGLQREIERLATEVEHEAADGARLRALVADDYATWCARWPRQSLPASPATLRDWVATFERLREADTQWSAAVIAHREAFRRRRAALADVTSLAALLGLGGPRDASLAGLLEAVGRCLDGEERAARDREARLERRRDLEGALPAQRRALTEASIAEEEAGAAFRSVISPFGEHLTLPIEAGALLVQLDELEDALRRREERRGRIEGIDGRSTTFEDEVAVLAATVGVTPRSPAEGARELVRQLHRVRSLEAGRLALDESRAEAQKLAEEADAGLAGLADALHLLAEEGAVGATEELGAVAARTRRVTELDVQVAEAEALLLAQGDGRPIDALEEEAAGFDLAELARLVEEHGAARGSAEEAREQAIEEERRLAHELAAMDGSELAAAELEIAQQELSRAREAADRFVRLTLARYLADEAIRRYREAHQDPVLARASDHLARLTDSQCRRIEASEDAHQRAVLSARFANGEEKEIGELSSGTRDALYFSLRLAAIEESARRAGPLPVVLDDVLVNFDDRRASRALECLADLAEGSQVLLFTHHRHLLVLADQALGERYCCHDLSAPEESVTGVS